jgi:hypothetical protein
MRLVFEKLAAARSRFNIIVSDKQAMRGWYQRAAAALARSPGPAAHWHSCWLQLGSEASARTRWGRVTATHGSGATAHRDLPQSVFVTAVPAGR